MTHPPRRLRATLKARPAHGTMDFVGHPFIYAFYLTPDYGQASVSHSEALGFLARIRVWLELLLGRNPSAFEAEFVGYHAPDNRRRLRQRSRNASKRRQGCALGHHIYRRQGLKACREWLYKYSLVWRLGWSFGRTREGISARGVIAQGGRPSFAMVLCGAPLKPD